MKKTLSLLLALVMIISCMFAITSCGGGNQGPKPELDLKDAEDNLEDEDYNVMSYDDPDDISEIGVEEKLYAIDEDYEESLTILVFIDSKTAKKYYDANIGMIELQKQALEDQLAWYEYVVKNLEDEVDDDDIDNAEDRIESLEDQLKELDEMCYGISGKTVWQGTEKAVKASKGK